MEYRILGLTGVKVSPICLGADDFGDATPPDVAVKIIINFFSTVCKLLFL
jgi:aryl-alcohol dehydrogenase-like predicted oxidoreductase